MVESEKVFINGRAQIIEMLKHMTIEERGKLLKNLRARSPQLANELMGQVLTFKDIFSLPTSVIKESFRKTDPKIVGLAIKNLNEDEQREVLRNLDRDHAMVAYDIMKNFSGPRSYELIKKAQDKLIQEMASHLKSNYSRSL